MSQNTTGEFSLHLRKLAVRARGVDDFDFIVKPLSAWRLQAWPLKAHVVESTRQQRAKRSRNKRTVDGALQLLRQGM